jgi:hypothetical protein
LLNIYLVRNFMLVPSRDGTIRPMSNKHENGTNAFFSAQHG